eukprot:XP_015581746.1 protein CROWDED NUCLEI 4 [Ricinus communis]
MASPITPGSVRGLSITPGARVLKTPLSDETIWKRLKEAGFDEESIKRRDKAALISYIVKLESEIYDLQHHMGLLILERKELASNCEQIKTSAETTELKHKRDQAAHLSALAEARKREESLKKALGVEKECIASIEKALHEMRAESAEIKVAADCKVAEAHSMVEDAQKKYTDAEAKLHAAEALQAEATQYRRAAERKLQEAQAREDDLSRRISTFRADCDAKEKEIDLERQTLSERRKLLQQEHERVLDGQALLNQREDYIASKSQELDCLEKELEASKGSVQEELRALNDEKSKLGVTVASLSQREQAVVEREALLNKREQDLLIMQEKLASKESVEIQKVIANHETLLRTRKLEFEAELEMNRKLAEDEIEAKRRAWELREVDLSQREELLNEKEHDLEVKSRVLADLEKDVTEKVNFLDEKERCLNAAEKENELRRALLDQQKNEINKMKLDIEKSLNSLENEKKQVDCAKEKLETMKNETNELAVLETKLKEEVDMLRAQKVELMAEEDRLKVEKAKFEAEWELIDEKREELQIEAERVAEERQSVCRLLKDGRDSLRVEKETIREQHKHDVELLNHEREEFMNKMVQERSEWFNKIQKEHADFLLGIEMQKRELENSIEKRREEIECYLRDQEKAFELEKKNELEHISSLREKAAKELEQAALEMKKLDSERMEINLDRDRRDIEWAVLNKSIEELKGQTQKLEKQRELLHAEREEVCAQIEHLKKLEDLKLMLDNMELAKMQQSNMESSQKKISAIRDLRQESTVKNADKISYKRVENGNSGDVLDSPSMQKLDVSPSPGSARFSWIKRCTELIFKGSPEKPLLKSEEESLISNHENASLISAGKLDSSNGFSEQVLKPGRKRRVKNSRLDGSADPWPEQRQNNKRRKQQEDAAVILSPDANNHSVTSNQENAPKTQHLTEEDSENHVQVAERIIKISEVTCEIAHIDNFPNQEKVEQQLIPEATCDHSAVQDGGTNGHANQGYVDHSLQPCGLEAPEMLKDQLGNDGRVTEQQQIHKDALETGDLIVEDSDAVKSDNSEKVAKDNRRRTRSEQKL